MTAPPQVVGAGAAQAEVSQKPRSYAGCLHVPFASALISGTYTRERRLFCVSDCGLRHCNRCRCRHRCQAQSRLLASRPDRGRPPSGAQPRYLRFICLTSRRRSSRSTSRIFLSAQSCLSMPHPAPATIPPLTNHNAKSLCIRIATSSLRMRAFRFPKPSFLSSVPTLTIFKHTLFPSGPHVIHVSIRIHVAA